MSVPIPHFCCSCVCEVIDMFSLQQAKWNVLGLFWPANGVISQPIGSHVDCHLNSMLSFVLVPIRKFIFYESDIVITF